MPPSLTALPALERHRAAIAAIFMHLPSSVVVEYIGDDRLKEVNDSYDELKAAISNLNSSERGMEELAVYFADCEAATTEDIAGIKGQKYQTKRHRDICEIMVQSLTHGTLVNKRPSDKEQVIGRLNGAIESCRKKLEK